MIVGIIGMTQGGTSATAAVVASLGIPMRGLDRTLDDAELFAHDASQKAVITKRNQKHNTWGWKYPIPWDPQQFPVLNYTDRLLVVWRDPIARSTHRRDLNSPNPPVFDESFEIMETYRHINRTHMHVSYEKLLTNTKKMVPLIADFLGVPTTFEAIDAVDHLRGYEKTREVNESKV